MESFIRATRRGSVILISLVSIAAGCGMISLLFHDNAVARLSTSSLLAVLGILLLPLITMGLLRLDQETARQHGPRSGL